ncbi:MAG: ABC transporter permease [Candidatus Hydrogenedentota bacterium]
MKAYLTRRILLIIPTFIGISIITFLMVQLSPGNPAMAKLNSMEGAMGANSVPQEIIDQTMKMYGFDKPMHIRYIKWMGDLVTLDFGNSFKDGRPVLERITGEKGISLTFWRNSSFWSSPIMITIQLNTIALVLIYLVSIPVGTYSATHQFTKSDNAITLTLFILYSLPSFWVAMLLMYFLGGGGGSATLHTLCENGFTRIGIVEWGAVQWILEHVLHFRWFPIYGFGTAGSKDWPFWQWFTDRMWHFCLPVFCLTYGGFATISRYARAGLIEVVRQDYIRTSRAYGFSERIVIFKYALRNSLIPIITILGTLIPSMIGGSVIIESIFSIPGMGRLFYESILGRDYPTVMGIFAITSILTLVGLIISDILYAITDPRIKFE